MKTKMFLMVAALLSATMFFSSCSSDDDNNNRAPNETLASALSSLYPNAKGISWETKGSYYVADCYVDNYDADVWFNAQGVWQMTEFDISYANLPQAVKDALAASDYSTWKIDDVDKLVYASGEVRYVIEVESGAKEYKLYFMEDGTLEDVKDVSDVDDTNWPNGDADAPVQTNSFTTALLELYPNATRIEWEREGVYYVADCYIGNYEADVWFDAQAVWQMTELDIAYTDLPQAVITALAASEYSSWKIDDLDKLVYADGEVLYVVEVESGAKEYNLFFTEEGVLKEAKDVSNIDDTNWPK